MGENLSKHVRKFAHGRGRAGPRATLYELEAEAMKALAHPKRLLILDLLSDGEERSVTDLQRETALSQSNLSQNLGAARPAGGGERLFLRPPGDVLGRDLRSACGALRRDVHDGGVSVV